MSFEGSPLHRAFVARLEPYLKQVAIYSRQIGSKTLSAMQVEELELLADYDRDEVGGLLGMTV